MKFDEIRELCEMRGLTEGSKVKDVCGLLEDMDVYDTKCEERVCRIKHLFVNFKERIKMCLATGLAEDIVFNGDDIDKDIEIDKRQKDYYKIKYSDNDYGGHYCELRQALECGTFSSYDVICDKARCPIETGKWKDYD